jgi:hypothetical protein
VTLVLSLAVSAIVAWISKEAIESILKRYFAEHIAVAMSKYLRFAVVVVGVAMGTRDAGTGAGRLHIRPFLD